MTGQTGKIQDDIISIFRKNLKKIEPVPTHLSSDLRPLPSIRCVAFDIYGTLFLSAAGEILAAPDFSQDGSTLPEIASLNGIIGQIPTSKIIDIFHAEIFREHQRLKKEGVSDPEVDILDIWRKTVNRIKPAAKPNSADLIRTAVEFESIVNPVSPAEGLVPLLEELRKAGIALGIVSNAQFYTQYLFKVFFDRELKDLGLQEDLVIWSYLVGEAKPSRRMFSQLKQTLMSGYGISPDQTLYVGNDMRNDIWSAGECGFKTCLFAGDKHSLRLRREELAGLKPDRMVTTLKDIAEIVL